MCVDVVQFLRKRAKNYKEKKPKEMTKTSNEADKVFRLFFVDISDVYCSANNLSL